MTNIEMTATDRELQSLHRKILKAGNKSVQQNGRTIGEFFERPVEGISASGAQYFLSDFSGDAKLNFRSNLLKQGFTGSFYKAFYNWGVSISLQTMPGALLEVRYTEGDVYVSINESPCEMCGGTGEVAEIQEVWAGEPHMADVGVKKCLCQLNDN